MIVRMVRTETVLKLIYYAASWVLLVGYAFLVPACAKHGVGVKNAPSEAAQRLYDDSQRQLHAKKYKQAYDSYQKAVLEDPGVANIAHLSSILYSWAISEGPAEDRALLDAQRKVWLEPNQMAMRRNLQSIAVDEKNGSIYALGLGAAMQANTSAEQHRLLAQRAALADAKAWIARLARWNKDGIDCPFDILANVKAVEVINKYWVDKTFCVVKLKAPVDRISR